MDWEGGPVEHEFTAGRLGGVPQWTQVLIVLVLGALIATGFWVRRSVAAPPKAPDPGFNTFCTGVDKDDPEIQINQSDPDDYDQWDESETTTIGYVDGARIGLATCLSASREVEVLKIKVLSSDHGLFQPTAGRGGPMTGGMDFDVPIFKGATIGPDAPLQVVIDGRMGACENFSVDTSIAISDMEVLYRLGDREAWATVDLGTKYRFLSPPDDQCPRPRVRN